MRETITTIQMFCEDCGTDVIVFGYIPEDGELIIEDHDESGHESHDLSLVS